MQSHTRIHGHCQQPTTPDRAGASTQAPATVACHAVPARLRGGWRCTPAGHRQFPIDCSPSPSRNSSASQQNRTSSTPSASPSTIRLPPFHSALLILARPLRWTAAASSPRSSWTRCAFTWPPTPARRSPRRSASSTSSTSPPRSLALTRRSSWSTSRRARSPKGRTRGSRMLPSPSLTTISLESPPARRTRRLRSSVELLRSRGALPLHRSLPLISSPSQRSCRRLDCIIWAWLHNKVCRLQPLCT